MAKQYGNFTDFISVARASSGTCLRKVKFGPTEITNGKFRGGYDGWSSGAGQITVSGGQVNLYNDTAAIADIKQAVSTIPGKVYRYSFNFIAGPDAHRVSIDSAGYQYTGDLAAENYPASGGFGVKSFQFVATSSTTYLRLMTNSTSISDETTISDVILEECQLDHKDGELILFNHPDNVARVEYDEYGRVIGTLIEEARTNSIDYSHEFDNAYWTKLDSAISNGPSAFGLTTKTLTRDDTSYGGLFLYDGTGYTVASSTDYVLSALVKAGSGVTSFDLALDTSGGGGYPLDNNRAAVTIAGDGSFSSVDPEFSSKHYGNGWYLISVTATSTTTGSIQYGIVSSGTTNFALNGTLHIAYMQLEVGAFATSYIPASGSTATRAADIDSIDVSQFGYNQQAGSVVVTASSWGTSNSSYPRLFEVNDGSGANRVALWINTSNNIALAADASSVSQVNSTVKSSYTPNTEVTIAYGFRQDDYAGSADGATIVTDATGDLPTTMTDLYIGQQHSSGQIINGHIKSIKYYPRRLTNDQLEALSS